MIRKISLLLLFSTSLLASLSIPHVVLAEVAFNPPDEDQPRSSSSGGSRGRHCSADATESSSALIPIVPQDFAGLTTQAHPSILVYVGETTASKAFFSIKDDQQQTQYYTNVDLPQSPGIIRIDLPEDAPELRMNQTYSWYFALMCDNQLRPDSPIAAGYLKRVALDNSLSSQTLAEETPSVNQASLYGQAGIWYETAMILAALRQAEPNNRAIAQAWDHLLTTAGLEAISTKPIVTP
ncbi:protein of unknown function DUF928 [Halothece sp. PCC 7418]|uniref:DUF928 domain-containing protein n=1 Tax=Halothece sp. (strain PCC 7418) TaxID=65093 RepID=UPI0002A07118|nr:DUF928 domain-containing protein [Halothece sp. PCC 7418]AFZ42846.1 protein of unknown function DUF928 [Halothece sp. PCC 7418]